MTLADWERNGWLTAHRTSPQEIRALLAIVERDLKDCTSDGLSPDWQLNIAYNAALQAAQAALAASGYRTSRSGFDHYRTIASLSLTLGLDPGLVRRLDAFRKRRNVSEYDRSGATSVGEAAEMRELADRVRGGLETWLRERHPELLS